MPANETVLYRTLRLGAAGWLLVVQPVALAVALDRALPRVATFGLADWLVLAVQAGVVVAAIVVGRRLMHGASAGAWRGVAIWALASLGATMLSQAWPALPTGRAPSEARVAAAIAVARDALLATLAAWLSRRGRGARDSS